MLHKPCRRDDETFNRPRRLMLMYSLKIHSRVLFAGAGSDPDPNVFPPDIFFCKRLLRPGGFLQGGLNPKP